VAALCVAPGPYVAIPALREPSASESTRGSSLLARLLECGPTVPVAVLFTLPVVVFVAYGSLTLAP
jgi:hypothetical protein